MNFTQIAYEKHGPATVIRFNRPESRNCVGPTTHRELVEAWTHFRDDDEAKVAIITGTGDRAFCAGGDLKDADGLIINEDAELAAHARGERPGILGPTRWTDPKREPLHHGCFIMFFETFASRISFWKLGRRSV